MTADPAADPACARQRLAAVAAVSALIVHSGRNRLTMARTALELLQIRREGDLNDEQRASFLQQLDLFLDEFNLGVDLLRCHDAALGPVAIRAVAAEALDTIRPLAVRAGIALEFAPADGPDVVRADRNLLRVALLNLLRNAVEALVESPPAGGGAARIRLRTALAGARAQLEVEDNGPGLPAKVHDRLFQDFVTGRPGGAGLGLSLCRDAMLVMDGTIAYLTPRGAAGGRFRLELGRWPS
jgi:two-component system C4-dicarboxylate transport sensor histidine kinase DctB